MPAMMIKYNKNHLIFTFLTTKSMKNKTLYTPPQAEELLVSVEAGFAYSGSINDTEEGDGWGPANE